MNQRERKQYDNYFGDQNIPAFRSFYPPYYNTLEKIGNTAFYNCGIKELILPDSVKTIGKSSFANCRELENVKLSSNLKSIPEEAFTSCKK